MVRKTGPGRPPKPFRLRKTQRVQVLVTPAEHGKLAKYAQARDMTVSELVRTHIRSLLERAKE